MAGDDAFTWLAMRHTSPAFYAALTHRTAPVVSAPEVAPFVLTPPPDKAPPRQVILRVRRVSVTRHWELCVSCEEPFGAKRDPRRWYGYGLCVPCYRRASEVERDFFNNITQRWRRASMRDFGKHDTDPLPVWSRDPSPVQVMLLRLAHVLGLTTPPGCEGTLCEGLDRRLGLPPDQIEAAIRGHGTLPPEARARLVNGALAWLDADEAHCREMERLYGDDDTDADPDDPEVLAVAAELRRELGRVT